ncbi:efflux RND transporter permease subunit [Chitinophaga nivalis]|uniref:Efflux RND transporter permease subunit n=1 Tax=Chitinophaga nivalis TaxID=2991709 RepID=A0ABT3IHH1_9BACT|nr:efflux RND transporter permease subunit [Chitinophaga nivalis]MCW3466916.1 efflux RND transporter permease subunit [Chitinophaga nivalis]MCW3483393.1 efflux RND transporter permease subunit [Chitinophaga nivalis]
MKIARYAVKNYQFTLVIFIMIIVLGITTMLNMPRSEDPELRSPQFTVVVVYPGTSPKDMEDLVVDPLEKEIYSLEDIKRVRTAISDGVAVIRVEYKYSSNVDQKYQELVREINNKKQELPTDIYSIEVKKSEPSDVNVLQVALISENASRDKLRYYAEKLQDELEKVPSLKNVKQHGLPDQQVRIELELDKMAQLHLPVNAVAAAIQSEMANIPGGSIDAGEKSFNIKTSGNYQSLDEISHTIVSAVNGKNIFLKDIARVYYGFEDEKYYVRLNGHRSVVVSAAQKTGENISKTQLQYKPVIEKFKKTLPANIDLVQYFDQANAVNNRLSGLGKDFIIAILLVALTLLPLGQRPALIVMISIPLSLSIGIVLLQLFGYNLNQLSIVGLVVALGLLVDDSIVVVENIERWMLEGHSRLEATLKATSQIGLAVIGCTAALIISFMPLVFMPEASGDFIRSLPLAVIFSVLASMAVSLTIIPFLSSRLLKEHTGHPEGNIFMRMLKKLIHGSYARLLDKALQRPALTILVSLVVFGGAVGLFKVVGFSLFPASEKPQFFINIITPPQSGLAYTNQVVQQIEKELKAQPDVKFYTSNIGKGNPRIYYNEVPENERSDYAQLFVQLDEHASPAKKMALIETLRKKWTPYPGARVEVKNFEQGPPVTAPVEVRVFGDNLDTLRLLAGQVEKMLENTAGTMYITNPVSNLKSDIRVQIDREKAQQLGIPTANIDKVVRLAIAGINLGKYNDKNDNDYDVLLTKQKTGKPTLDVFKDLYVNNSQGTAIPLAQVAQLQFETSPLSIHHQEKNRVVTVGAFVKKGFLADRVINEVIRQMDALRLPAGYSYEMGGEVESRNNSFGGFMNIIIVTVFMFIGVLILQFKTFKSTLIVLSVIPLGIVGAVTALWLTGNSLSFVAIIGLIALAGIEVKNTILLVDFTNQLRMQGHSLEDAIREAGEVRFLPIVLTSLTAIGGLIPIAISTNPLIAPLAIVLIGGLISSTLLSRIVTPVVYKLMPPAIEPVATTPPPAHNGEAYGLKKAGMISGS